MTAVFAALLCVQPIPVLAGDMTPIPTRAPQSTGVLDGKVFTGQFGSVSGEALVRDTWIFEAGTFMSKQCKECGYPRGAYDTNQRGGQTRFVAETPCPKTDARIVWRGTIEDGRIEGVATWTLKRWYRTIQKKFWFKGQLRDATQATKGP